MGKKISLLALLMSIMLLCFMGMTALAAPSRTIDDITDVDTDQDVDIDIITDPEKSNDPQVKAMVAELDKMVEFLDTAGNDIIDFFQEDVRDAIEELLPSGFDMENLEMSEFIVVGSIDVNGAEGEVTAAFEFVTEYEVGQTIVALVGIADEEGNITWIPLEAKVLEGGMVEIVFTEEALDALQDKPFALGILSEKED